jgi:hypothetical protein
MDLSILRNVDLPWPFAGTRIPSCGQIGVDVAVETPQRDQGALRRRQHHPIADHPLD